MTVHEAHAGRINADGSMNFAPRTTEPLGDIITGLLDTALVERTRAEYEATRGSGQGDVAGKRIGAGYIGTECDRALAFRYHRAEKEKREEYVSAGELQRHADAGHWTEDRTAQWLRWAGFALSTHKTDADGNAILDAHGKPKQYGFMTARDPQTGQFRMAGEVDGIITAVPTPCVGRIRTPCIWESKKATAKKWKLFSEKGVAAADPKYYGQVQTCMAYMEITQTLFSMLNLDTMKYYFEVIEFDRPVAQHLTDRAARVLRSYSPADLARITGDRNDRRCKFCDYREQCWDEPRVAGLAGPAPAWLAGGQARD